MENGSIDFSLIHQQLPRAFQGKLADGDIRTVNSDFTVEEILPFEPTGVGEHLFLQIEKTGCNTDWVIQQILKTFALTSKEVGYAGKKDRYSVSTQWFSLHLPGKEVNPELIENQSLVVKRAIRHNKKLRVGSVKENRFKIIVRNLSYPIDQNTVENIRRFGFPNYFGSQRFGRNFGNLIKAESLLVGGKKIKNRNLKGLVLSSARSLLFNLQLAKRLEAKNWLNIVDGDCINLNHSQSYYHLDVSSEKEQQRIESGDTHICGWLPGKQPSDATDKALQLEVAATQKFSNWLDGVKRFNLDSQRRAFRTFAKELQIIEKDNVATFQFSLAKGCFATSLLNELLHCNDVAANQTTDHQSSTKGAS